MASEVAIRREAGKYYEQMSDVVAEYLKGATPTQIAKKLNIKRADVIQHVENWQKYAGQNKEIMSRAKEALASMDEHFNMILNALWDTVEQADNVADLKTKSTTLKSIADVEAKRVDALQKAGLIDDADLAQQLAETEEKIVKIKEFLKNLVNMYPDTREYLMDGLARIFDDAVVEVKVINAES